ncbi:hypothetical protein HPL003_11095 [Paenibacillus terrae HPL-003]|uniref:Uncharacterized protein n=1 Tax=Paenibacillus terrae (strain HPL-003) TaxID=985665 RepID=G7VXD7_PAETH|nr:hypothetical protein [Paenibacillus terrae]AET58978.1 hypothetical protein HPL003_11095 [Paenibacillus terrae HPL-003]
MIAFYIIGTFVVVLVLSWILGAIGINIFEGPNASALYFYGSIIIGILLNINDELGDNKNKQQVDKESVK